MLAMLQLQQVPRQRKRKSDQCAQDTCRKGWFTFVVQNVTQMDSKLKNFN